MDVRVISKPNCPECVRAKHYLQQANISYTEQVIGVDIDRESVLAEFPSARSAPIVTINGEYVGGPDQLTVWLKQYGYTPVTL